MSGSEERELRVLTSWLNFVLTPAGAELGADFVKEQRRKALDAKEIASVLQNAQIAVPATKEESSVLFYASGDWLNDLRRRAAEQYLELKELLEKIDTAVQDGKVVTRKDKSVHNVTAVQKAILQILHSVHPLWLRIGLETVFAEQIRMRNNADFSSMTRFIFSRLFNDPGLRETHGFANVRHFVKDEYVTEIGKHFLKKFLRLFIFLDNAKKRRLISYDPYLFMPDAGYKCVKDILNAMTTEVLSAESSLSKLLDRLGCRFTYKQGYIDEFHFCVNKLLVDLRDGVILARVVELLTDDFTLTSKLRCPPRDLLQKRHNVSVSLEALAKRSIIAKDCKDLSQKIVEGDRKKTVQLLWCILLHFYNIMKLKMDDMINNDVFPLLKRVVNSSTNDVKMLSLCEFKKRFKAAMVIQRYWRKVLARRKRAHERVSQLQMADATGTASTFIIFDMHSKSVDVCPLPTRNMEQDNYEARVSSTVTIQKMYRRRQARISLQREIERRICLRRMVILLQAVCRKHMVQLRLHQTQLIVGLQAKCRGVLLRQRLMSEFEECSRIRAAITIQTFYRGYRQKRALEESKRQAAFEQFVIKLQSFCRAAIVRNHCSYSRALVVYFQAVARGMLGRRAFYRRVMITQLQAQMKGCLVRRNYSLAMIELQQRNAAATVIQRFLRHRNQRVLLERILEERIRTKSLLIHLQARCRGFLIRSRYLEENATSQQQASCNDSDSYANDQNSSCKITVDGSQVSDTLIINHVHERQLVVESVDSNSVRSCYVLDEVTVETEEMNADVSSSFRKLALGDVSVDGTSCSNVSHIDMQYIELDATDSDPNGTALHDHYAASLALSNEILDKQSLGASHILENIDEFGSVNNDQAASNIVVAETGLSVCVTSSNNDDRNSFGTITSSSRYEELTSVGIPADLYCESLSDEDENQPESAVGYEPFRLLNSDLSEAVFPSTKTDANTSVELLYNDADGFEKRISIAENEKVDDSCKRDESIQSSSARNSDGWLRSPICMKDRVSSGHKVAKLTTDAAFEVGSCKRSSLESSNTPKTFIRGKTLLRSTENVQCETIITERAVKSIYCVKEPTSADSTPSKNSFTECIRSQYGDTINATPEPQSSIDRERASFDAATENTGSPAKSIDCFKEAISAGASPKKRLSVTDANITEYADKIVATPERQLPTDCRYSSANRSTEARKSDFVRGGSPPPRKSGGRIAIGTSFNDKNLSNIDDQEIIRHQAATKIQALWRGYICRKSIHTQREDVAVIHKRIIAATEAAKEEETLFARTSYGLEELLNYKWLSQIRRACLHLYAVTRLSETCCIRVAQSDAVPVLLQLFGEMNQSFGSQHVIESAISILLNLAKCVATRGVISDTDGCVETLVGLLSKFHAGRDQLFVQTSLILIIICNEESVKVQFLEKSRMKEKIVAVFAGLQKKENHRLEKEKQTAQKVGYLSNKCTVPPKPFWKRCAWRFTPDWILSTDKPRENLSKYEAISWLLYAYRDVIS